MAHENLSRTQHVEGSSDRNFGLVFSAVFAIVACWPMLHGELPRWWSLGVAAAFAALAAARPAWLSGPNRLWTRLGVILANVVSPIALGILFYGALTPIGFLVRLAGKDPLRLKFDPATDSYWIVRQPPGPPPDSMNDQF